MSASSLRLLFRSSRFAVQPGEDEATNPGIFGKALAEWVGTKLLEGFTATQVIAEDFGWLIQFPEPSCALYIACSSTDEQADEWQIMVIAESRAFSMFRRKKANLESVAAELFGRVRELVAREPGITELRIED